MRVGVRAAATCEIPGHFRGLKAPEPPSRAVAVDGVVEPARERQVGEVLPTLQRTTPSPTQQCTPPCQEQQPLTVSIQRLRDLTSAKLRK
jgi:hypothetical protein